jgi:ATP-dependent RNA helicase SUPV3L1/SUV3
LLKVRNIKRVVFATLEKFDAGHLRYLHPPQIKQIAGRAGRFRVAGAETGSTVPDNIGGSVNALRRGDLRLLREGIAAPNPELTHAMLWPPWKIFERFVQEFPEGTPLATMISQFAEIGKTSPHYRIVESGDQVSLAQAIEQIPNIDLESRYSITFAPITTRSEDQTFLFVRLAEVLSIARPVTIETPKLKIPLWVLDKKDYKMTSSKLHTLEVIHKLIMCYCWLSYLQIIQQYTNNTSVRWPALYTHYDLAQKWKGRTEQLIHEALQSMKTEIPEKKGSKRKKVLEKKEVESFTQHVASV